MGFHLVFLALGGCRTGIGIGNADPAVTPADTDTDTDADTDTGGDTDPDGDLGVLHPDSVAFTAIIRAENGHLGSWSLNGEEFVPSVLFVVLADRSPDGSIPDLAHYCMVQVPLIDEDPASMDGFDVWGAWYLDFSEGEVADGNCAGIAEAWGEDPLEVLGGLGISVGLGPVSDAMANDLAVDSSDWVTHPDSLAGIYLGLDSSPGLGASYAEVLAAGSDGSALTSDGSYVDVDVSDAKDLPDGIFNGSFYYWFDPADVLSPP